MFDRGAASIEPQTLRLVHARPRVTFPFKRLRRRPQHRLTAAHVEYHYRLIFRG
jgi:hypothetical protein